MSLVNSLHICFAKLAARVLNQKTLIRYNFGSWWWDSYSVLFVLNVKCFFPGLYVESLVPS